MSAGAADRNLLFGVLALQMDFISRDQLVAAMNAWVLEKQQPLGALLRTRGALDEEQHAALEAMVQVHLRKHDGDAEKSLAAVPVSSALREQIRSLSHPEIEVSLGHLGAAADMDATASYAVGEPTTAGLRFRILRPHAEGGLGKVSVALDEELHREVALKEIKATHADEPHSRGRFVLEAEITGGLEHPGIVPVYGLGTYQDGRPFYAMRFIRGDSLKDAIARFHRSSATDHADQTNRGNIDYAGLECRQLLGRFIDVCQALQYAHDRGVLHRDLKPGNIMLGKYGETLVVDWGLAKCSAHAGREETAVSVEPPLRPQSGSSVHETVAGTAVGTPAFMSPEQAEGRLDRLGPASDVYSLGATLYCVITGRPPLGDQSLAEILKKVCQGDFPRPSALKPGVPRALEAICLKAMALRPADRYASARALADDVEHWLADEPVIACSEPWPVRAARWTRRHRTLVSSAAAVVLVTAIASSVAALVVGGLNRQLETANAELVASNTQLDAARTLAEANAQTAKVEAATATAVKDFLQSDLLQLASAREQHREEQRGTLQVDPDLKVRDLVLRAAEKIEGKFQDQPLVEAEIRATLGRTLLAIGSADRAIAQFTRVREIVTSRLGADHPDTLSSMRHLATSYRDAGRQQEALELREETLHLSKARFGPDHIATLLSMNNLANSYRDAGRTQEALALNEETLQLMKAKLGPNHPDTLKGMHNLANAFADAGRIQEALKLHEQTLKRRKAKLGPAHPDTLLSMNNLAAAYADAGRIQQALQLRDETHQLSKAKLGPDHPDTLRSMNNLANSYAEAGRSQEALQLREETLPLMKARFGLDHPDTLRGMHNLASSYADAGRSQQALKLREETLQLMKATFGPDHPDTLKGMRNLANSYLDAGRTQEALALHEDTLQRGKASLGPDHPDTLASMSSLAASYGAAGRTQQALKLHEETLEIRKARLGADHRDTLASMNNLALCYAAAGRSHEALELHEDTLQLSRVKLGPDHPDTLRSMSNLANSYAAASRSQEALKLREEALQLSKAKLGPAHPDTLASMSKVASTYAGAGRAQDALKLYEEALPHRQAKLGAGHPDTLLNMNNLAACYLGAVDSKALVLLAETLALRQRGVLANPGNRLEQGRLAWTHAQLGEAAQLRHDYAAAVKAYRQALEMFDQLDQAGALQDAFLRGRMNFYRQQLSLCRKAEQAVHSLDFVLQQPAAEVALLLALRGRYLVKEQKLPAALETAAQLKERARQVSALYNAACLYALCAAAAKDAKAPLPDGEGSDNLADEAMALLTRAVAQGYRNAAHMKQDRELEILRTRPDFDKLLARIGP